MSHDVHGHELNRRRRARCTFSDCDLLHNEKVTTMWTCCKCVRSERLLSTCFHLVHGSAASDQHHMQLGLCAETSARVPSTCSTQQSHALSTFRGFKPVNFEHAGRKALVTPCLFSILSRVISNEWWQARHCSPYNGRGRRVD